MKKLSLFVFLTGLSIGAQAAHPQCGKTPLSDLMDDMKDSVNVIKKSLKADNIGAVNTEAKKLLTIVSNAKKHVPLQVSDKKSLNAEQKAQFSDYQKGMDMVAEKIQLLVQAKDKKAGMNALKEVSKVTKSGHKDFKMDCDD